jgi:hypothetical protein
MTESVERRARPRLRHVLMAVVGPPVTFAVLTAVALWGVGLAHGAVPSEIEYAVAVINLCLSIAVWLMPLVHARRRPVLMSIGYVAAMTPVTVVCGGFGALLLLDMVGEVLRAMPGRW